MFLKYPHRKGFVVVQWNNGVYLFINFYMVSGKILCMIAINDSNTFKHIERNFRYIDLALKPYLKG